jgi:hypothetical protein
MPENRKSPKTEGVKKVKFFPEQELIILNQQNETVQKVLDSLIELICSEQRFLNI